jgi:hypothetical protein
MRRLGAVGAPALSLVVRGDSGLRIVRRYRVCLNAAAPLRAGGAPPSLPLLVEAVGRKHAAVLKRPTADRKPGAGATISPSPGPEAAG